MYIYEEFSSQIKFFRISYCKIKINIYLCRSDKPFVMDAIFTTEEVRKVKEAVEKEMADGELKNGTNEFYVMIDDDREARVTVYYEGDVSYEEISYDLPPEKVGCEWCEVRNVEIYEDDDVREGEMNVMIEEHYGLSYRRHSRDNWE